MKKASAYFRNKRSLQRHLQANDEVSDSASRDFTKAVKSSSALCFALRKKDEKASFPELKFKSEFAPSNTTETRSREGAITHGEKDYVRSHPAFWSLGRADGIEICKKLPEITNSIRLQRLREGEYCTAVRRFVEFQPTQSSRVCAIDPGVRNFTTVYDPDSQTFSLKGDYTVLKRWIEVTDAMK
ncbi:hypothetical protein BBJ28_00000023 [Nothophytophthora sp. Chile5]|nr:hypothetical protein BBJ28_00000023 [Nothophytophthora sp. Chile5]